jgi:POT family proton-dependent oligopeptide transporter
LQSSLPFIIAAFADICAGDFWTLAILLCVFFVPGVLLIFLSAVPFLLGETFPLEIFRVGMQILYTVGSGGVDAICDIFGAKQFHPVRHAHLFEPYFVWTLVMAGIGGIVAEIGYSMIANVNVAISFGIMFIFIAIVTLLFFFGSKRYVVRKVNRGDLLLSGLAAVKASFCWKKADNGRIVACRPGFNKVKESNGGPIRDDLVSAARRLFLIIPVQALFIPGNLAYQQFATLLIPMSFSMEHPRLWIGTNMIFVNSASVALFGIFCNKFLYPYLEERSIRLSMIRKVVIGQSFFVLLYLSMIGIDHRIRRIYEETGEKINIGWQFFPYFISAPAIIFYFPPLNALAYMIAPNEWKILGNAIYTFMLAGAPNLIARALYKRYGEWFAPTNGSTTINGIENYTNASSNKFMWLMCGSAALQVLLCMLPGVDRLYQKIENDINAENKEGLITKGVDTTETNTTVLPGQEIDAEN